VYNNLMKFQTLHVHRNNFHPSFEFVLMLLPLIAFALTVFAVLNFSPIKNPQVEAAHTEVTP
jgi:hypothetical protein